MASQKIEKLKTLKTLIATQGFTVFAEDIDINSGKNPFIAIPVSRTELAGDEYGTTNEIEEYRIKLSALHALIKVSGIYTVTEGPKLTSVKKARGACTTECYVIDVPEHAVNSSLDYFESRFAVLYESQLVHQKNLTNLVKLEEILNILELKTTIPQYANQKPKTEVQVHAPAEALSAISLTLKSLKLNFELDPKDPTIFKPVKADTITMLAPIGGEFVTKYVGFEQQTSEVKKSLLAYRTWVEERIDWFQDHPKTTFALSILGLVLALIPGIIVIAAYFVGTNSTKPVDDFIIALGKGEKAAEEACKTFPDKNGMMKSACIGIQKIFHPQQIIAVIEQNAEAQVKKILDSLNPPQPVVQTVTIQPTNPAQFQTPVPTTAPKQAQAQQPNTPTPGDTAPNPPQQ
jgi:hypothetical protein